MKKRLIFLLLGFGLLIVSSCQIKSVEDIVGKWKYQKSEAEAERGTGEEANADEEVAAEEEAKTADGEWYILEISADGSCSFTVFKDGEAETPLSGKCTIISEGKIFLIFEEIGKQKEFLVKKGIGKLYLSNVNNEEERMVFSVDKGGE